MCRMIAMRRREIINKRARARAPLVWPAARATRHSLRSRGIRPDERFMPSAARTTPRHNKCRDAVGGGGGGGKKRAPKGH